MTAGLDRSFHNDLGGAETLVARRIAHGDDDGHHLPLSRAGTAHLSVPSAATFSPSGPSLSRVSDVTLLGPGDDPMLELEAGSCRDRGRRDDDQLFAPETVEGIVEVNVAKHKAVVARRDRDEQLRRGYEIEPLLDRKVIVKPFAHFDTEGHLIEPVDGEQPGAVARGVNGCRHWPAPPTMAISVPEAPFRPATLFGSPIMPEVVRRVDRADKDRSRPRRNGLNDGTGDEAAWGVREVTHFVRTHAEPIALRPSRRNTPWARRRSQTLRPPPKL